MQQTTEYDNAASRVTAWFWVPGLFLTFLLANSVLGARLREGQGNDPLPAAAARQSTAQA